MAPRTKSLYFFGLNAIRALSIIALVLLFASSIVTLVQDVKAVNTFIADGKEETVTSGNTTTTLDCSDVDYVPNSDVPNQTAGAFWAVLNRLLITFQAIVLILSEIGWPASFFRRYFPILGDEFGLGALGVIQCLLGAAVLSHNVDTFCLVSAWFLFALGCINMLLGLIFREKAKPRREIAYWREDDEVLPRTSLRGPRPFLTAVNTGNLTWSEKGADASRSGSLMSQKSGLGFGRKGEKAALQRGATLTSPPESLPSYAPRPSALSPAPTYISRSVKYIKSEDTPAPEHTQQRPVSVVSYVSSEGSEAGHAV